MTSHSAACDIQKLRESSIKEIANRRVVLPLRVRKPQFWYIMVKVTSLRVYLGGEGMGKHCSCVLRGHGQLLCLFHRSPEK